MAGMEWITSPEAWIALITLTVLEIVLGIDNIIFISILSGRLPAHQQQRARTLGLALAMFTRIALLASISWISRLTTELFTVFGHGVTGRDLVFLLGGLFLIWKATQEIHERLEGQSHTDKPAVVASFASVISQIVLLDIVFSLDSVITAVGMADDLVVMIIAVVVAVGIMMFAAGPVSTFVEEHPTVKMLALAFLIMIGVSLLADGLGQHIPKGYIYFAMAFSVAVEFLNLRAARVAARDRDPVKLKPRQPPEPSSSD
jgi:predicted tellurium resistance membrane protein TerC